MSKNEIERATKKRIEPSKEVTKEPTKESAKEPTKGPTKEPSKEPSKEPAKEPTKEPTKEPAKELTEETIKKTVEEYSNKHFQEYHEEHTMEHVTDKAEDMSIKAGRMVGVQSVQLSKAVYIESSAAVVGMKEGEGPLGGLFDVISSDDMMGSDNWEEAESSLQKEAVTLALGKAGLAAADIRYLLAGDLLAQTVASSFGLMGFDTPVLGVYGACSTCGEALGIGSMLIGGGFADRLACVTSSHFASAEKEFRFPLGYGSQRPKCSSWTVTGSGAFVLGTEKKSRVRAKITGITSGKIIDYGIKDSFNMGCCMAPAACDTIYRNLQDFGRTPDDYDRIFTGDLGEIGQQALFNLLAEKQINITAQHLDCGMLIYDAKKQGTEAGGSGCGCAATVLSAYVLPKLETGEWNRVLFVPTGAMLSKTSFNEGQTIPAVAHAVVLEHV